MAVSRTLTRNYAYMFELFGQLVKDNIIDLQTVMNSLKYIVVKDWKVMYPMITYLNKQYSLKLNPWENFEWLARQTARYLQGPEAQAVSKESKV